MGRWLCYSYSDMGKKQRFRKPSVSLVFYASQICMLGNGSFSFWVLYVRFFVDDVDLYKASGASLGSSLSLAAVWRTTQGWQKNKILKSKKLATGSRVLL